MLDKLTQKSAAEKRKPTIKGKLKTTFIDSDNPRYGTKISE